MREYIGTSITKNDLNEVQTQLLDSDESIIAIAPGKVSIKDSWRTHFLVVTNRRVILYARAFTTPTIFSFPLNLVKTVHTQKGLWLGASIDLLTEKGNWRFQSMKNEDVDAIARIIRHQIQSLQDTSQIHIHLDFTALADALKHKGIIIQSLECPKCHAQIQYPQQGNITICTYCKANIYVTEIAHQYAQILGNAIKKDHL